MEGGAATRAPKSNGGLATKEDSKHSRKRDTERKKRAEQRPVQPSIPDIPEIQAAGGRYFDTHTHLDQILGRVRFY